MLAFGPLGIPVALVEAGGLLFGNGLPGLVDGGGETGVELGLGARGEHEPAGRRRVAAEGALLLAEDDLLARQCWLHAGGEASDAGADDEDVGLLREVDRGRAHNGAGCSLVGHRGARQRRRARRQARRPAKLDKIPTCELYESAPFCSLYNSSASSAPCASPTPGPLSELLTMPSWSHYAWNPAQAHHRWWIKRQACGAVVRAFEIVAVKLYQREPMRKAPLRYALGLN